MLGGEYKVTRSIAARTMGRGRNGKLERWELRALKANPSSFLLFTNTIRYDRRRRLIDNPFLIKVWMLPLVVKTDALHEGKHQ